MTTIGIDIVNIQEITKALSEYVQDAFECIHLTIFTNRFPKLRLEVPTHTNSATKKRTPQNGAPSEGNTFEGQSYSFLKTAASFSEALILERQM